VKAQREKGHVTGEKLAGGSTLRKERLNICKVKKNFKEGQISAHYPDQKGRKGRVCG